MSYLTTYSDENYVINSDLSVTMSVNPVANAGNVSHTYTKAEFEGDYIKSSPVFANAIATGTYGATNVTPLALAVFEFGVLNGNWTKAQVDAALANAVANNKPFQSSHNVGTVSTAEVLAGKYGESTITSPNPQISTTLVTKTVPAPDANGVTHVSADAAYTVNATVHADAIQKAYIAYFNRPADPTGFNYWDGVIKNGGSLDGAFSNFGASAEYNNTYAGMNSSQRVDAIYQGLFGRSSEKTGLDYWVGQLDAGKLTIQGIVNAVMAGAQGSDMQVVNNRVDAAKTFTGTLNNNTLVESYNGSKSGVVAKTWLSTVTSDTATATTAKNSIPDTLKSFGISGTVTKSSSGTAFNLIDGKKDILIYSSGDAGKSDTVVGWNGDKIDVSKLAFTGNALGVKVLTDTVQQTSSTTLLANSGVAIAKVGSDSFVYIDVNKDGVFNTSVDATIKVVGATLTAGDIAF